MSTWDAFAEQEPDLAELARLFLDANKHKTIATIRRDGSPRISGTEVQFCLGALYCGTMEGAVRVGDLRRDPRYALHSASPDPGPDNTGWDGDAKIAGRATEITDQDELSAWAAELDQDMAEVADDNFHLFRLDVLEVVATSLNDARDGLIIDLWTASKGRSTFLR